MKRSIGVVLLGALLMFAGDMLLLKPVVGRLPKGIRVIVSGGRTNLIFVVDYAAVLIACS